MNIIEVQNTRQIRGKEFRAVQAASDADALAALEQITKRLGVTFEIVYRWGQGYYYAPVEVRL